MARSTMSPLITRCRQLIRDTDSVLFTDDDQIQDVLDEDSYRVDRHRLRTGQSRKVYTAEVRDLEGVVKNGTGGWTGTGDPTLLAIYASRSTSADTLTPDTWDLRKGVFTFTAAQSDVTYFLDAQVYDPYLAAAKLCEELTLESIFTPGVNETGGAIVGRFDYERAALRFRRYAKPTRIELHRVRSKRRVR